MLRPLGAGMLSNIALGAGLALLAVAFEWMLRDTAVTHMLGAFLGGAIGLLLAKGISEALFWIDHGDQRVAFMHSFILLVFPVHRRGRRRPQGRLAGAGAADRACSGPPGPSATTRFSTPR